MHYCFVYGVCRILEIKAYKSNIYFYLCHFFPVNILGNLLSLRDKVKNLGVIFDSSFRFSAQVTIIFVILQESDATWIKLQPLQSQMH